MVTAPTKARKPAPLRKPQSLPLRKRKPRDLQAIANAAWLLVAKARRDKQRAAASPVARARAQQQALARRARRDQGAAIVSEEERPRYSQAEIDELGRQGRALRKRDGSYGWPIADGRDLRLALAQWTPSVPEAIAVKAFTRKRAIALRLDSELPKSWLPALPKPLENERQRRGLLR